MQRSGRASRLGLEVVLVATLLTLFLGFAHKASCLIDGDFDRRAYRTFCYSDLVPLYRQEGLLERKIPYLEARNEYPVLTGLFMWGASQVSRSEGSFLFANAIGLMALGLVTAAILYRLVGERALFFSLAPALVLTGVLNWDLLPVTFSTAGVAAFLWRRDAPAGVLLGLGAAAKAYPALVAIPICLDRLREGDRRGAVRIAGFGAATWLVVNLPFALASFERWSYFFRFSSSRPPTPGTLWYAACRTLTGEDGCGAIGAVNALSALAFVAGALVLWRASVRSDPDGRPWRLALPLLALFLLTSKVYSPQYSLWLLPFFALVLPDVRWFALFAAADAAVFVTELSWLGRVKGVGGLPAWPLGLAVVARAAVLMGLIAVAVTRRPAGPEPFPQALTNTSPSSSS
jgi:uncharacterized membrane protein